METDKRRKKIADGMGTCSNSREGVFVHSKGHKSEVDAMVGFVPFNTGSRVLECINCMTVFVFCRVFAEGFPIFSNIAWQRKFDFVTILRRTNYVRPGADGIGCIGNN
jgi:polyferredoxin